VLLGSVARHAEIVDGGRTRCIRRDPRRPASRQGGEGMPQGREIRRVGDARGVGQALAQERRDAVFPLEIILRCK
jgi:hypothetical protein